MRYSSTVLSLLAIFLVVALSACGEDTVTEKEAQPYVQEWSGSVEESLRDVAFAPAAKNELKSRIEAGAAKQKSGVQRTEPPYDVFVEKTYADNDYELMLVDSHGLTERGKAAWSAVKAVEDHALDPQPYRLDEIASQLEQVESIAAKLDSMEPFQPDSGLQESAVSWVMSKPRAEFTLDAENYTTVTEAMLEDPAGEQMNQRMDQYRGLADELGKAQATLEHLLARDTARYAREMRYFKLQDIFVHEREDDPWTDPEVEGRRPDKAKGAYRGGQVWRHAARMANEIGDDNEVAILHEKIQAVLDSVVIGDEPTETIEGLPPQHPQYAKLVDEYRRYKEIVEAGGWAEVSERRGLRNGSSGETVAKLKKRLQIEGYYPEDAPIDETFGDTLEEAVEAYQKTHQMRVDGRAHSMFWSSVNIPAERRMKQIGINLQRWRESDIRHSDPRYVYVNIPDFHVEVWDEQERAMRFRIVVGNNDLKIDEESKEKEHPNRTPTLSAYIDRVIYNPFWNVTDRIRAEEILPEVRAQVEGAYKAKLARLVEQAEEKRASARESTFASGGVFGSDNSAPQQRESAPSASNESASDSSADDVEDAQPAADNDEDSADSAGDKPVEDRASIGKYLTKGPEGKQVAFRVSAIRSLLSEVYGSSTKEAGASESGDAAGGEDGESTSLLATHFPYVDAETGLVDVSETDPDNIPAWYEANEYEVMFPGKKWEYVRMKQGDKNALGKVKVIFPNLHDVYLHDTPKKALFSRDLRAFSHGCMRMHKPLSFAEYLLKRDGQLSDYNIDHILRETTYKPIFLHKQIPVHVEYRTVRVGDEGRAHFLADIYDYDDKALSESDG
ncbi:MAG: L,D-transpeptidase family protein [Myxococcota bacterium]